MIKNKIEIPFDFTLVNQNKVRLTALSVCILSAAFVFTGSWLIPAFLVLDFAARALNLYQYSLLDGISKIMVELFSIEAIPVNQVPKSFTARLGFSFTCLILSLVLIDFTITAKLLSGTIAVFSILEAATPLNIDAYLYSVYTKFQKKRKEPTDLITGITNVKSLF